MRFSRVGAVGALGDMFGREIEQHLPTNSGQATISIGHRRMLKGGAEWPRNSNANLTVSLFHN
jgi:hypothetical protein